MQALGKSGVAVKGVLIWKGATKHFYASLHDIQNVIISMGKVIIKDVLLHT